MTGARGGRPGTAQLGTARGGRVVQSASYFVTLIRERSADVEAETTRLRHETERAAREAVAITTMSRQHDVLVREVRSLEGELADHNLARDKLRQGVDAAELAAYSAAISRRNAETSREADALFLERTECERGVARLEEQQADLRRIAEDRIASLPRDSVAEFRALSDENTALSVAIRAQQDELERLNSLIQSAKQEMARDTATSEFRTLEAQVHKPLLNRLILVSRTRTHSRL